MGGEDNGCHQQAGKLFLVATATERKEGVASILGLKLEVKDSLFGISFRRSKRRIHRCPTAATGTVGKVTQGKERIP